MHEAAVVGCEPRTGPPRVGSSGHDRAADQQKDEIDHDDRSLSPRPNKSTPAGGAVDETWILV